MCGQCWKNWKIKMIVTGRHYDEQLFQEDWCLYRDTYNFLNSQSAHWQTGRISYMLQKGFHSFTDSAICVVVSMLPVGWSKTYSYHPTHLARTSVVISKHNELQSGWKPAFGSRLSYHPERSNHKRWRKLGGFCPDWIPTDSNSIPVWLYRCGEAVSSFGGYICANDHHIALSERCK